MTHVRKSTPAAYQYCTPVAHLNALADIFGYSFARLTYELVYKFNGHGQANFWASNRQLALLTHISERNLKRVRSEFVEHGLVFFGTKVVRGSTTGFFELDIQLIELHNQEAQRLCETCGDPTPAWQALARAKLKAFIKSYKEKQGDNLAQSTGTFWPNALGHFGPVYNTSGILEKRKEIITTPDPELVVVDECIRLQEPEPMADIAPVATPFPAHKSLEEKRPVREESQDWVPRSNGSPHVPIINQVLNMALNRSKISKAQLSVPGRDIPLEILHHVSKRVLGGIGTEEATWGVIKLISQERWTQPNDMVKIETSLADTSAALTLSPEEIKQTYGKEIQIISAYTTTEDAIALIRRKGAKVAMYYVRQMERERFREQSKAIFTKWLINKVEKDPDDVYSPVKQLNNNYTGLLNNLIGDLLNAKKIQLE